MVNYFQRKYAISLLNSYKEHHFILIIKERDRETHLTVKMQ